MLITLSCRASQLTGVAPLGALIHRYNFKIIINIIIITIISIIYYRYILDNFFFFLSLFIYMMAEGKNNSVLQNCIMAINV
jgi:hypothetical protein